MKGESWMHAKTPHNPDPSMEERCAFYKWALDQLEAGVAELEIAEATGLHAESGRPHLTRRTNVSPVGDLPEGPGHNNGRLRLRL
jgi:hypothetical protein